MRIFLELRVRSLPNFWGMFPAVNLLRAKGQRLPSMIALFMYLISYTLMKLCILMGENIPFNA